MSFIEDRLSSAPEKRLPRHLPHFGPLDGWRGISILAVLCAHFLPLGPARWDLNAAAGLFGMSIFFTLSGFLITSTLYYQPSVRVFIIRRSFRILPLALAFICICLTLEHAPAKTWLAHLFFYADLPPFPLTPWTSHFWSLCVEMQYYAFTALFFLFLRERSLLLTPVFALCVTALRIHAQVRYSIVTVYRVDEILSGATLAVLLHGRWADRFRHVASAIPPALPLALLLLSTHARFPALNYLRPYFAALIVGTSLMPGRARWTAILSSRPLKYLASISYALYIFQEPMHTGWFEAGTKLMKYAKRPLGLGLAFLLAHLSSKYFEPVWIRLGKKLSTQILTSESATQVTSAV